MAKDFDFTRQPRKTYRPAQQSLVATKKPKKSRSWWLLLVGLGLILVAAGLYWQYRYDSPKASPASSATSEESPPATTQNSQAEIKVYDGGAGEQASKDLVAKLAANNLTAVYLGRALDSYSGVQVWFSPDYKDLAEEITTVIAGTNVAQHEAQVSGNYQVLIFVGR